MGGLIRRNTQSKHLSPISQHSSVISYLLSLGPVALWAPQAGNAGLVNQVNPGTHDAALIGSASISGSSRLGQALVVPGGSDGATASYNAALDPDDVTILVYAARDGVGVGDDFLACDNGGQTGWALKSAGGGNEVTRFSVEDGAGAPTNIDGSSVVTAGQWALHGATLSGGAGGDASVFHNGVLEAGPTTVAGYAKHGANDLVLGNSMAGKIGFVALFNRELTTTEHATVYTLLN